MRSYDLFALAVVAMIVGHANGYLADNSSLWHIPDRILVPVFLVSIGYNAARKNSRLLWLGAIVMTYSNWLLKWWIRLDILAMIILLRYILDPVMSWAMKSRTRFVALNLALLVSYPLTNRYGEYGSLSLIMAMAGWINKNRSEVSSSIVTPGRYFAFAYAALLACTTLDRTFQFSYVEYFMIAAGLAWTMYVLYNFRQLVLNAIAAKPRDPIEKFCSFVGHKSLEIYVIHSLLFQFLVGVTRIVS